LDLRKINHLAASRVVSSLRLMGDLVEFDNGISRACQLLPGPITDDCFLREEDDLDPTISGFSHTTIRLQGCLAARGT